MSTCPSPLDPIRDLYTALAESPERDFGWATGRDNARSLGYEEAWIEALPAEALWASAAAVGNPFSLGRIRAGETVIDLGSGSGADACIAALMVGPNGRVLGVDCTPAMLIKARAQAAAAELEQVELYEADMADLPLPDACADVVISNGAINLSPDKPAVLAEALRVLRPGGRLQVADMVRTGPADSACRCDESWANCVSGTLPVEEYLELLRQAGFVDVGCTGETGYRTAENTVGALFRARKKA